MTRTSDAIVARRSQVRSLAAILALVLVASLVATGREASAASVTTCTAAPGSTCYLGPNTTLIDMSGTAYTDLVTVSNIVIAPGKGRYIYARLVATSSVSSGTNLLQVVKVSCFDAAGAYAMPIVISSRNNRGYSVDSPGLAITLRALLPTTTGGVYSCKMSARGDHPTATLKALGGGSTSNDSVLIVEGPDRTGRTWGLEQDWSYLASLGENYYQDKFQIGQPASGTLPEGTSEYLLRSGTFTVDNLVKTLDVVAELEFTVCYNGTNSCPSKAYGSSGIKNAGSVVTSTLQVQQYKTYPTTCGSAQTQVLTTPITSAAHHQKVQLRLPSASVSGAAGCTRTFSVKVLVSVSTTYNPIQEETDYPYGPTKVYWSNGIVMNNY